MAVPPVAAPARMPPAEADLVGAFVVGNGIVLPDLSLTGLPKTLGGGANLPPLTLIGLARTSAGGASLDILF